MRIELEVDLCSRRANQNLPKPEASKAKGLKRTRQHRLARQLALAHHLDHLRRTGQASDLAEIARMTGVSRARISQIADLTHLSPDIQQRILDGSIRLAAHDLRRVAQIPEWNLQRFQLK